MIRLTDRQFAILRFISKHIEECSVPPTFREIGKRMGIASTNGVYEHLHALERKGMLWRGNPADGVRTRAMRITERGQAALRLRERVSFVLHGEVYAAVTLVQRVTEAA